MKIGIAQIASQRGNVQANIERHLQFIERAIQLEVDLIIFPELSITNYEPELAKELASTPSDSRFQPFQLISDTHKMVVLIGMPLKNKHGITISQLIFQPNKPVSVYSKQLLHEDEFPYFVAQANESVLEINGKKLALGICFETLQRDHFISSAINNPKVFLASVAKSEAGIAKANAFFSEISKEYSLPILMSNSIGPSDNFIAAGQSAIWDATGERVIQLDNTAEGLVIYELASGNALFSSID